MRKSILSIVCLLVVMGTAGAAERECTGSQSLGVSASIRLDCEGDDADLCIMLEKVTPLRMAEVVASCKVDPDQVLCRVIPLRQRSIRASVAGGGSSFCLDCEDCWDYDCCCWGEDFCDCEVLFYCPPEVRVSCTPCGGQSCGWQRDIGSSCRYYCYPCNCG